MEHERTPIVLKFGGASVSSAESFSFIADIALDRYRKSGGKVIVVVSAMGNTTDQLISLAQQVNPNPPRRELDMLLSVGERISTSLLAMSLAAKDIPAVSFTGSQAGILTSDHHSEARILNVRPHRLLPHLQAGKIVIVAGFQGMSLATGDITTLGRGGSDTTAVALAVALRANHVEFFKDVHGIYDKDPKKYNDAKFLHTLSYQEALDITNKGARILHSRCIDLARKNHLPLRILNFTRYLEEDTGSIILPSSSFYTPVKKSENREYSPIFEEIQ